MLIMSFQQFFHCDSFSAARASTMMMPSTKDDHAGGGNCRSPRRRVVKKWSMAAFSFYLILMACVTFMATPVSSAVMTLNDSTEICGMTLNNPDGYDFAASFLGDIECNGSGPTLDGSVLDCEGKSIKYIGSNPRGNNGLVLQNGSTAMNCIVSGFQHGIVVSNSATKVTVTGCESRNNIYYGGLVTGGGSMTGDVEFTSCIFENNNQGLVLNRNIGGAATITDCEVRNSSFHGILIRSKAEVTIVGGVIEDNERHGVLATRFGATKKLTIMDVEILSNDKYAVAIAGSQDHAPEITGAMMEASMTGGGGALYTRGVMPEVSCSDLFGTMVGFIDDSGGGVCTEKGKCGDRTSMCASVVIQGVFLSPSEFCGQTLTGGPKKYELDPDLTYDCSGSSGVTLNGNSLVLDCNNAIVDGGDTPGTRGISVISGTASITNCEVSGFNDGVAGVGSAMITVTTSKINNNRRHGFLVKTGDAKVTDSEANENGKDGFRGSYEKANGSLRLERVIATNNGEDGILVRYLLSHTGDFYVKDSVVANNENIGINMESSVNYFEIESCKVYGNSDSYYPAIFMKSGMSGGKIKNSFVTGGARGIHIITFAAGTITVSCSEVTANNRVNNVDGEGIRAFDSAANLEIMNSMIHDHNKWNVFGDSAAYTLNNVYACGSRNDNPNIEVTPTAPDGSSSVCDDGAAGGACATDCSSGVTTQSFAANLVSSGACPDFGWWNVE